MERRAKILSKYLHGANEPGKILLIADTFRDILKDALSQASMYVHKLKQRYGNGTIERMTDHTFTLISDCEKKITALWEEASGRNAYDGTPLENNDGSRGKIA